MEMALEPRVPWHPSHPHMSPHPPCEEDSGTKLGLWRDEIGPSGCPDSVNRETTGAWCVKPLPCLVSLDSISVDAKGGSNWVRCVLKSCSLELSRSCQWHWFPCWNFKAPKQPCLMDSFSYYFAQLVNDTFKSFFFLCGRWRGMSGNHDLDAWFGQAEMKGLPGAPYPTAAHKAIGGHTVALDKCRDWALPGAVMGHTAGSPPQCFIVRTLTNGTPVAPEEPSRSPSWCDFPLFFPPKVLLLSGGLALLTPSMWNYVSTKWKNSIIFMPVFQTPVEPTFSHPERYLGEREAELGITEWS